MTTTTDIPLDQTPARGGRQRGQRAVSRSSRWRSNWRIGLLMGLRDARRYRGRSALIVAMIGLPVLILVGGLALYATSDVTSAEALPTTLGRTAAQVVDNQSAEGLVQDADARNTSSVAGRPARTVPGHTPGAAWTADQIADVTGGAVLPVGYTGTPVRVDGRWRDARLMLVSGSDLVRSGLGELVDGRFPDRPGELAVTAQAVRRGWPTQGPLTVRSTDGAGITFTVVGVVRATGPEYGPLDAMTVDPRLVAFQRSFLVERSTPIDWAEVQRLNGYGLAVLSRAVVTDPSTVGEPDPSLGSTGGTNLAPVALVVLGLVAETTLLAGPAFAVSAARRRRSLALAAANGAERHQIRQYVLAQALVLGGLAVVLGAAAGVLGAVLVVAALEWTSAYARFGPFQVPWLPVLGVVGLALGASVLAALIPARGSGRLDVSAVLAGRSHPGPVRRSAPVVGAVLMVVGGATAITLGQRSPAPGWVPYGVAAADLIVLVGAIGTVPTILSALVRLSGGVGLAVRLAARDSVRQRSRAVPAVAAIMVTTAAITVLGVGDRSGQAQDEAAYTAGAVAGRGVVDHDAEADGSQTLAEIGRRHPEWAQWPRGFLGSRIGHEGMTGPQQTVGLRPAGCSAAQTVQVSADDAVARRCRLVGNDSAAGEIVVADPALVDPAVSVAPEQQRVLSSGGMLVTVASLMTGGRVEVAVGAYDAASPDEITLDRTVSLPAAVMTPDQLRRAFLGAGQPYAGWVLPATAERLRLPVAPERTEIIAPAGISAAEQQQVNDVVDPNATLYVERGYQPPGDLVMTIMFAVAGLLVLVAALIATALGQAESRGDLATLAALGSTVGLRRRLAAAQAVLVALTGTVLGIVVGLPAGIAAALVNGSSRYVEDGGRPPAVIAMPWLGFALLLTVVPALAVTVAALGVRRVPSMTRRID